MSAKLLIIVAVAVALVAAVAVLSLRNQSSLTSRLPVPIHCVNQLDARIRAGEGAIGVLGTGSMAADVNGKAYIPADPRGTTNSKTVVAYVRLRKDAKFEDIQKGDLCLYAPAWSLGYVLHVAALLDALGWIMSGINNAHSEPGWRVTRDNFKGIVEAVYLWDLQKI